MTDVLTKFEAIAELPAASCQLPVSETSWPACRSVLSKEGSFKCTLLSDRTERTEHSRTQMAIDGIGTEHTMLAV